MIHRLNASQRLRQILAEDPDISFKELDARLKAEGIAFGAASSAPTLYSDFRQSHKALREAGWKSPAEVATLIARAREEGREEALAEADAAPGRISIEAAARALRERGFEVTLVAR